MDWKQHLEPYEVASLMRLAKERKENIRSRKRIVDRAKLRAKRAALKEGTQ